jgi:hypothetical protein
MTGPPQFSGATGAFAVDYRNHDGTIILGQGDWLFATKWGAAGNGSIYAYRDGGPRVAVASGVSTIEQVTSDVFSGANFSSRTRKPREGEVVLWLNNRGFAAAVEIRKVSITPESEDGTVLEGRYRILIDGTRDFTDPSSADFAKLQQALAESLQAFENLTDLSAQEHRESEVGIGHNRPPAEFSLTKADFSSTIVELQAAIHEPRSEEPLRRVYDAAIAAVRRIARLVGRRLQLIEEGFFRQIGASAFALGGWLAFSGTLEQVAQAALALGAKLFGW